MNNSTSKPTSENLFNFKMHQDQAIWISSFIVNIILITLSMWLTASSTLYISKYSKKNFERNRKRLLQMAILASALTLPRLLLTHLLFWIGYNDDEEDQTCEILMDTSVIAYVLAFIMVYLFLWMRQHFIYKQPSITSINTKTIRVLSWTCFTYIILGAIAVIFLFVKDTGHQSTSIGCYARTNITNVNELISFNVFYLSSAVVVLAQISVFALLVYPLIRHWNLHTDQTNIQTQYNRNLMAMSRNVSSYAENELTVSLTNYTTISQIKNRNTTIAPKKKTLMKSRSKSTQSSSMQRLHRVIRTNAVCALGCIVSDLSVNIVVGVVIGGTQPRYFTSTILDISMVLNIIFFLRSFDNYKDIFCSIFQCEKAL